MGCGPPVFDQAQTADLAAEATDLRAAADAGPRAQDALTGRLLQLFGLPAAGALVLDRAVGQGAGVQAQQRDPVGEHVVHLAGDPGALGVAGLLDEQLLLGLGVADSLLP